MEELELTFDPTGFTKGLEAISSGIGEMTKQFINFASVSNKKVQQVQFSAFSLVKALAPIAIAAKGIQAAFRRIPEIGRTFSIAGDIMMRNFLWPLRKMLLPILQRFLDWVRDNRAMFLRWGNVVANIFRTVFNLVKGVFNLLKRFWERVSSGIERVFGKTVNSMTELVNIALFKLTAIAEFILLSLQPVFDFIADLFISALKNVKAFINGFMTGLGDLMPELESMWSSLSRIGRAIDRIAGKTGSLTKVFRFFGNTVGLVAGIITRTLGIALDFAATKIEDLQLTLEGFQAWREGNVAKQKDVLQRQNKLQEDFNKRFLNTINRQTDAFKDAGKDMGDFIGVLNPTVQMQKAVKKSTEQSTKEITNQSKVVEKIGKTPASPVPTFLRNIQKQNTTNKNIRNERNTTNTKNINNTRNFSNIRNNTFNNPVNKTQIKNINNNKQQPIKNETVNNNFTINVQGGTGTQQTADQTAQAIRGILLDRKFKTGGR